jgi:hypothetical protein
MIAGLGHRAWSLLIVPLVLSLGGVATAAVDPVPPTPAYSPPTREPSPFSTPDAFCDPAQNNFDLVEPTGTRTSSEPVTVVVLDPGTGNDVVGQEVEAFAGLINDCGGIGGRTLDVSVEPDSGNATVNCLVATRQRHAFMVVAMAPSAAAPCIVRDQRTILVTATDAPNTDLTSNGGRLVVTGSNEGITRARVQALIDDDRLDRRRVAVVAGSAVDSSDFVAETTAVLRANKIPVVTPDHADTVLEASLDPATVTAPHSARKGLPYEIYDFSDHPDQTLDRLRTSIGADLPRALRTAAVYSFASVEDPGFRSVRPPSGFSNMCTTEYQAALAKTAGPVATTTTVPSDVPPTLEAQQVADVCLMMRIVARALFAAGIDLTQRAAIRALHRLPFIDSTAPGGIAKPRPNQVLNEPARRIQQVVVLDKAEAPCTNDTIPSTTSAVPSCWSTAPDWDDGGRVVNVPLTTPTH